MANSWGRDPGDLNSTPSIATDALPDLEQVTSSACHCLPISETGLLTPSRCNATSLGQALSGSMQRPARQGTYVLL